MKIKPPKIPVRIPAVAKVIPRSAASAQPSVPNVFPTAAAVPWPPVKPEAIRMPKPGLTSGNKARMSVSVKKIPTANCKKNATLRNMVKLKTRFTALSPLPFPAEKPLTPTTVKMRIINTPE